MTEKQIETQLLQKPFHPLKVMTTDGTTFKIPFVHVAVLMRDSLLVFIGVKSSTSRSAKSFKVIPFDRINRIVAERPSHKRPRKAG